VRGIETDQCSLFGQKGVVLSVVMISVYESPRMYAGHFVMTPQGQGAIVVEAPEAGTVVVTTAVVDGAVPLPGIANF